MTRHTKLKIISFTFTAVLFAIVAFISWLFGSKIIDLAFSYITLMIGVVLGFINSQVAQDVENDYFKADKEEESTYEE